MKKLLLLVTALICVWQTQAQKDTTRVKTKETNVVTVEEDSISTKVRIMDKNVVTVLEDSAGTKVEVGKNGGVQVIADHDGDTVRIRIGRRVFDVVDSEKGTEISTKREPWENRKRYEKFNGHWGGFEMGVNTFHTEDYSLYEGADFGHFFDLNYGKSLTVNLNFAEFAFSNQRQTIGLISGMGLSFMDFCFDRPDRTIDKSPSGLIEPFALENAKKSKFSVSYLTAPLILEIATPLRMNNQRLTIAAGVIGGLNIGSHTKIKYDKDKDKDKGNFNINPLKYELTGRLCFGDLAIFANYSMTPLFKEGKGPELFPLVVGISFPNIDF